MGYELMITVHSDNATFSMLRVACIASPLNRDRPHRLTSPIVTTDRVESAKLECWQRMCVKPLSVKNVAFVCTAMKR